MAMVKRQDYTVRTGKKGLTFVYTIPFDTREEARAYGEVRVRRGRYSRFRVLPLSNGKFGLVFRRVRG